MSLVVVDQFRMTADSYCKVTAADGTVTYETGYPKLFQLPGNLRYQDAESFVSIGYVGDPKAFVAFYRAMQDLWGKNATLDWRVLETIRLPELASLKVIVPFENQVVTLTYYEGTDAVTEVKEGGTHGFGSAYTPKSDGLNDECRAWFSIFFDALEDERLPGYDIHYLPHRRTPQPEAEATPDTVKPAGVVKRFGSRMSTFRYSKRTSRKKSQRH